MVAFLEDHHALHGIPLLDGVDRVDPVLDPSKNGVLAVEVGGRVQRRAPREGVAAGAGVRFPPPAARGGGL